MVMRERSATESKPSMDAEPLKSKRQPPPLKSTLEALGLTLVGIVFLIAALVVFFRKGLYDALPFFIMSAIGTSIHLSPIQTRLGALPGVYHGIILIRAYLGHPGFDYGMIPSFD
jgi:hypothetical protein